MMVTKKGIRNISDRASGIGSSMKAMTLAAVETNVEMARRIHMPGRVVAKTSE